MHSSLKVSWLFNCCDGGSNIKTVQKKECNKYILDEVHTSLPRLHMSEKFSRGTITPTETDKIKKSHVTLMWYR